MQWGTASRGASTESRHPVVHSRACFEPSCVSLVSGLSTLISRKTSAATAGLGEVMSSFQRCGVQGPSPPPVPWDLPPGPVATQSSCWWYADAISSQLCPTWHLHHRNICKQVEQAIEMGHSCLTGAACPRTERWIQDTDLDFLLVPTWFLPSRTTPLSILNPNLSPQLPIWFLTSGFNLVHNKFLKFHQQNLMGQSFS